MLCELQCAAGIMCLGEAAAGVLEAPYLQVGHRLKGGLRGWLGGDVRV